MRCAGGPDPTFEARNARAAERFRLSAGSSLTLAALGVVYGDIGTSPLYAVRQSLVDFGDMSERAILGALSLIVWALGAGRHGQIRRSSSCGPTTAARAGCSR